MAIEQGAQIDTNNETASVEKLSPPARVLLHYMTYFAQYIGNCGSSQEGISL